MSTYTIPHTPSPRRRAILCGEILPIVLGLMIGFVGIAVAKAAIETNLDRQAQEASR